LKRKTALMLWPASIVVILDQLTKWAIVNNLRVHESIPILAGFFNLVHVRNRGMAFGLMNRPGNDLSFYFLTAASLFAVAFLFVWFYRMKEEDWRVSLGLSLVLGGAIGNLIDRLRFREVVDFLDLYFGHYHWPAFNVADSAITVGTVWLAISLILQSKRRSGKERKDTPPKSRVSPK
jgi:signal peptidase II